MRQPMAARRPAGPARRQRSRHRGTESWPCARRSAGTAAANRRGLSSEWTAPRQSASEASRFQEPRRAFQSRRPWHPENHGSAAAPAVLGLPSMESSLRPSLRLLPRRRRAGRGPAVRARPRSRRALRSARAMLVELLTNRAVERAEADNATDPRSAASTRERATGTCTGIVPCWLRRTTASTWRIKPRHEAVSRQLFGAARVDHGAVYPQRPSSGQPPQAAICSQHLQQSSSSSLVALRSGLRLDSAGPRRREASVLLSIGRLERRVAGGAATELAHTPRARPRRLPGLARVLKPADEVDCDLLLGVAAELVRVALQPALEHESANVRTEAAAMRAGSEPWRRVSHPSEQRRRPCARSPRAYTARAAGSGRGVPPSQDAAVPEGSRCSAWATAYARRTHARVRCS